MIMITMGTGVGGGFFVADPRQVNPGPRTRRRKRHEKRRCDRFCSTSHLNHLQSRNNRLAWLGLQQDGLMDAVDQLVDRIGADRIGVVMGTSTSSIGRTEEGYNCFFNSRYSGCAPSSSPGGGCLSNPGSPGTKWNPAGICCYSKRGN